MKCIHGRLTSSALKCSECTTVTGSPSVYMIGAPEITASVAQTLEQRGEKYGPYKDMAALAQKLKNTMRSPAISNWEDLPAQHRESLDVIATKLSRILCGDWNDLDTWHDIQGYAALIEREIKSERPKAVSGSSPATA